MPNQSAPPIEMFWPSIATPVFSFQLGVAAQEYISDPDYISREATLPFVPFDSTRSRFVVPHPYVEHESLSVERMVNGSQNYVGRSIRRKNDAMPEGAEHRVLVCEGPRQVPLDPETPDVLTYCYVSWTDQNGRPFSVPSVACNAGHVYSVRNGRGVVYFRDVRGRVNVVLAKLRIRANSSDSDQFAVELVRGLADLKQGDEAYWRPLVDRAADGYRYYF